MSASLDEDIARVADLALRFAGESELFVQAESSRRRGKALAIATFARLCAPAAPSPAGLALAVRLLSILLYLDDVPKEDLDPCCREMLEVLREPRFGPALPQARALRDYVRDLSIHGDTSGFRAQFERCLCAIRDEAALLEGDLSVEEYRALRPRLIFVEEYVWTWLLSERMPCDAAGLEHTARLRRLASDVCYLVNDLGSVDRDRAPGSDPNLVFLIQRQRGLTEAAAIELVTGLHDDTARDYREELARVRGEGATSAVLALAEVVDFVVRGNLATTRKLSGVRYPGAQERLARLAEY